MFSQLMSMGRIGGTIFSGRAIEMRNIGSYLSVLPRYEDGMITLWVAPTMSYIDPSGNEQVIELASTVTLLNNGTVVLAGDTRKTTFRAGDLFLTGRSGSTKTKRIVIVNARTLN